MKNKEMPDVIYVSPRGSGTMSGVYTDYNLKDEAIIVKYIRADLANKSEWLDINGMPKRGFFLVCQDDVDYNVPTVINADLYWSDNEKTPSHLSFKHFTHWMPLPLPPTTAPVDNSVDREVMCDDIEQIISDTHDIDARDIDYAKNIMAYINNYNVTKKGV